jgi:hypothetical protein
MKFVYVDESGSAADPIFVFFGLQVDAYRLKKVMRDADALFEKVAAAYPEGLRELKSSRMVNGVGGWRKVDPVVRKDLFLALCSFVDGAKASGYTFALRTAQYEELRDKFNLGTWLATPWLAGATTLSMFAQKTNQGESNNKGMTVLIFDDNKAELPQLSDFIVSSCAEVDEYYERAKRTEPFDTIIDTAFGIKSDHSTLVQISDACAYAIRRTAELEICGLDPAWDGEGAFSEMHSLFSVTVSSTLAGLGPAPPGAT